MMARFLLMVFCLLVTPTVWSQEQSPKTQKKRSPFRWVNPPPAKYSSLVRHETFRSPSMDVDVGYNLYLPPGYSESRERFPVVYYLHGGRPGSESKSLGLVEMIDKAIRASGKRGAIYVFVNGGPVSHYDMPQDDAAQGATVFVKELIPHIDATYRTIAHRNGRAIEGFSQGGRGTMRLSLRYPDLFVCASPGGGGYETERRISESGGRESEHLKFAEGDNVYDLAKDYVARRDQGSAPTVQWLLHVGTKGFNYQNNLAYMQYLNDLGIPHDKIIVEGAKHSAKEIYAQQGQQIVLFHLKHFGQ